MFSCKWVLALAIIGSNTADGFLPTPPNTQIISANGAYPLMSTSMKVSDDSAFAAFADLLDDDEETDGGARTSDALKEKQVQVQQTWQTAVDDLLDPTTATSRRQELLGSLLESNEDIRESVVTALRDRKIDAILTPRGKKLQDGTRAVARQLSSDILPSLTSTMESSPLGATPASLPNLFPSPDEMSKVGSRILNALGNQAKKNLETLQDDLADPTNRIPERISKQTEGLMAEARNVFMEKPVGLKGPRYMIVATTDDYEIRDYESYKVAATTMAKDAVLGETVGSQNGDGSNADGTSINVAGQGAAFNTLAAYLFGSNRDGKTMEMTTPVTTTSWGEMRFYLDTTAGGDDENIPEPLDNYEESGIFYDTGSVQIVDIPAARLAVRRFTGFVTDGEVARQKDTLLNVLQLDGIDLNVPHGEPISHVIFQYNPPYTIPIVRCNEIAVPVLSEAAEDPYSEEEWGDGEDIPSDM